MPLPLFATARTTHHEALDWATRASANGGTISTTLLRAVSDFCATIDRNSLRDRFVRLNPFAGGNLSGALVPLYRSTSFGGTVLGNATDTNNNFVSGDFTETTGLKGNGTTKFLNTGFTPASFVSTSSVHLSYSGTGLETTSAATSGSGDRFGIGTYNNTEGGLYDLSVAHYLSATGPNQRGSRMSTFTFYTYASSSSCGATESHLIGTRTSTTAAALYGAGSSIATNGGTVTPSSHSQPFYVFGLNLNGTAGVLTAGTFRMYSIGNGLNATQAAAFSAAVAALNTALGR
jgi:hypothetical protein